MKRHLIALLAWVMFAASGFAASVNINIPGGGVKALVCNPFNIPPNDLNTVFPIVPDGTTVLTWSCAAGSYYSETYDSAAGTWTPDVTIAPGQAFFISSPGAPASVTLTGLPPVPASNSYCGCGKFSFMGLQTTNATGTFEELTGLSPVSGTVLYAWNQASQSYITYTFSSRGAWSPSEPVITNGVGVQVYFPCVTNACLQVLCSSDKTEPCGAVWNFDPPTVSTCCPSNFVTSTGVLTNVLVTAMTPVTNGVCPQYTVTETWLIMDACGDTNVCSQVVTVNCCTNTCISLQCPTNIVVESCTNVALTYAAIASDSCCSNFTVQYNPPSGSFFAPGTVTTVFVTASDVCSNVANCSFTVTVNSGGGLQVLCATNKTVQCGTTWSFDPPTASSCCSNFPGTTTNIAVSAENTVTNGVCPQVAITQKWLITDACGDSNSCSQTVTVVGCCTNSGPCCGPNLGPETIHWLPLPTNGTLNPNGLSLNTNNTWIVTNLPCYGNVLITQDFPAPSPSLVDWFLNPNMVNVQNAYGMFNFTEAGYGPYSWGTGSWLDLLNDTSTPIDYSVNFYFLDGQPNPCTLYLGVTGLGQNTTATVSQTVAFRTEYDLFANAPGGDGYASADTTLNGVIPSPSGTTGTVVGSAYNMNSVGDPQNTGWAVLQPTSGLPATTLPTGSGQDVNGNTFPASTASVPYMTLAVHQGLGDGIGFTLGYVCCAPCLSVQCSTNKTVQCGSTWSFDPPVVSSCCPNFPGTTTNVDVVVTGTVTNGVCPRLITRTWLITDSCGTSNTCSQTVAVEDNTPPILNCSSNRTVQCGTTWSFNTPTAADACSGASLPLTFTTMTNGVCPKVFTRTWTATNACGLSNSCSQQVTQVDTMPPVVNCRNYYPFGIIVPLNTNCYMVIPRLRPPPASDNCTPQNQLIYTQSPPAGTMYYGAQSVLVTVTVTDLCGNSAQCHVAVTGMGRIGPVLTAPATITVTNCVVPCVLPLVSATDCSCPPGSLRYTQSPPCGTVLGPGQDTVTVTVTDCHGLKASKVIHLVITGSISFLANNLYNTGVVPPTLLPSLAFDTHYTLTGAPAPVPIGQPVAAVHPLYPWNLPPMPPSLFVYSEFIAPNYDTADGGGNNPPGVYTYKLPFTLPNGVALNSVSISGRWAADNGGGLYLNLPISSGHLVSAIAQSYGFNHWTYFTIPPTAPYVAGANTLYFVVTNDFGGASYTGLRAEFTNAVANCQDCVGPSIKTLTPATTGVLGGSATLQVTPQGTPPFGYQWYHNGVPIAGATSSSLTLNGLTYASGGQYEVAVTNSCGQLEGFTSLRIVPPWYWWWAWWNVPLVTAPLSANFGPDLQLVGTNSTTTNNAITSGTTDDFGLPEVGGQVVNVMHVGPLTPDTSILIPQITPAGTNSVGSYSVLMDLFVPDNTTKLNNTLFASEACCIGNPANGVALVLDAQNNLHITGSADGSTFDFIGSTPFDTNSWNRVALVVDNPFADGTASNLTDVTVSLYLDGQYIGGGDVPTTNGLSVDWSGIPPLILSVQSTDGLYATDIQFHSIAIGSDLLTEMGSPDSGPIPLSTPVMIAPALTATQSNGVITLSWSGTSFALQEADNLSDDGTSWTDSDAAFTETQSNGTTQSTATANPSTSGPSKFYRLVFRP